MSCSFVRRNLAPAVLAVGLCAAALAVTTLIPSREAAAQPRAGWRPELTYVPDDAALFVYLDVAQLWDSPAGKSVRQTDPKLIGELTTTVKEQFGESPENLSTVTLFFPKVKGPGDLQKFGVIFTFRKPFDKARLQAGLAKLVNKDVRTAVHTPNDRTAVCLVGLDDSYAKPQPIKEPGPLLGAIRDAATRKHVFVAGANLDNLPDELRGNDLDAKFEGFRPLLKAQTITARIDLAADITIDVRVKTATPAQAIDAEKALGLLGTLIQEQLGEGIKELGRDDKNAPVKDLVTILKAGQMGVKGAKYSTDGTEARAVVKIPADLPFGTAIVGAVTKIREAAELSQSANNLKQIALAMHNYETVYSKFPPAAVCNRQGKPMLSWRVLILPYIEHENLYREFKLDEPWDSDHNKKLIAKMPRVYALPSQKPDDTKTHYRVFVGGGAGFDYLAGYGVANYTDGTSNTIMVVTAADAVPWTKPEELAFDPDKTDVTKQIGLVVNGKAQMALFDGSVQTFGPLPKRATLNGMITRSGGEVVNFDD